MIYLFISFPQHGVSLMYSITDFFYWMNCFEARGKTAILWQGPKIMKQRPKGVTWMPP